MPDAVTPKLVLRSARAEDLERLVLLEEQAFDGDRIARRSWRRFIKSANAAVLIADAESEIAGALVLLFNRTTAIARVYSIAVASTHRRQGIGARLLDAAIQCASEHDCALIRLETRTDNHAAQKLFAEKGFTVFGRKPGYYHDGADALRLERPIWAGRVAGLGRDRFTYYGQTLDFTCGPSAVMIALSGIDPAFKPSRPMEIRLWREATTVFMASGHGGCGCYGLALAAYRLGYGVTVYAPPKNAGPMFVDSVRDPQKKEVIALIEKDMVEEIAGTEIVLRRGILSTEALVRHLQRGEVPVVLISLYRLHGEKGAHWVAITGFDGHVFQVFDPMLPESGERPGLSIAPRELERMSRYGRSRHAAAVVLSRSRES